MTDSYAPRSQKAWHSHAKWIEIMILSAIPAISPFMTALEGSQFSPEIILLYLLPGALLAIKYGAVLCTMATLIYAGSTIFYFSVMGIEFDLSNLSQNLFFPVLLLTIISLIADQQLRRIRTLDARLENHKKDLSIISQKYRIVQNAYNEVKINIATTTLPSSPTPSSLPASPKSRIEQFCEQYKEDCGHYDQHLDQLIARLMPLFTGCETLISTAIYQFSSTNHLKKIIQFQCQAPSELSIHNTPMLASAIKKKKPVYVSSENLESKNIDDAVIVLPIVDASNTLWAVLVVYEYSLVEFDGETLDSLQHYSHIAGNLLSEHYTPTEEIRA